MKRGYRNGKGEVAVAVAVAVALALALALATARARARATPTELGGTSGKGREGRIDLTPGRAYAATHISFDGAGLA
jgi:hypothetical protein